MKNVRSKFAGLCLGFGLFALAAFPVIGFAQSSAKYEYFEMPGGGRVLSAIGQAPAGANAAQGQAVWDRAVGLDGGMPKASGTGQLRVPTGANVPVGVTGRVTGAGAAAAFGRAIPKMLKQFAGPLGVGMVVYDLAKELGFDASKDSSGDLVVQQAATDADGLDHIFSDSSGASGSWAATVAGAIASYEAATGAHYWEFNGNCHAFFDAPRMSSYCAYYGSRSAQIVAAGSPATLQQLLDAIAAKSGWPSTSKVGPALVESLNAVPSPAVATGPLTVTGPATSPGGKTVTNDVTNNTTNTQTTTHNHSYAGDTVTTTTTTTNITINNSTGAVTNNTTSTKEAEPTPADQCKDNPDSSGCAKLGVAPEPDTLVKKSVAVTVVLTAFAGGSCPPGITFSAMGRSYSISYTPICDTLALLKFLFLAISGVIAAYILAETFRV